MTLLRSGSLATAYEIVLRKKSCPNCAACTGLFNVGVWIAEYPFSVAPWNGCI
jgi:hypothetical protein